MPTHRSLPADLMVELATEARGLGFRRLGLTGGEMFMRPDMPGVLDALTAVLPVVALTNGTLFTDRLLDRLDPLRRP